MLPGIREGLGCYIDLLKNAEALIITNERKFSNYYKNLLL